MPRKNAKAKDIKLVEETQEVENTTTTNAPHTQDNSPNRGEIIDVEWESVKNIYEFKNNLQELEQYFANMCLHFEKEKSRVMTQINYGQNDLYMMAQQLQKNLNVDEELTYELKLPTAEGEKGFFVRKDD